jgi:hypothetical protein
MGVRGGGRLNTMTDRLDVICSDVVTPGFSSTLNMEEAFDLTTVCPIPEDSILHTNCLQ